MVQGQCAKRFGGRRADSAREDDRATAQGDARRVIEAVVVLGLEADIVVEGQGAVVDVHAGGVQEGAVVTQAGGAAHEGEGAGHGIGAAKHLGATAKAGEVDGAGDLTTEVGGVTHHKQRRAARGGQRSASVGQDGTQALERTHILGVAIEVESATEINLRRAGNCRTAGKEGVQSAVQHHGAAGDVGRGIVELLRVEVQGASAGFVDNAGESRVDIQSRAGLDLNESLVGEADLGGVDRVVAASVEDAASGERQRPVCCADGESAAVDFECVERAAGG